MIKQLMESNMDIHLFMFATSVFLNWLLFCSNINLRNKNQDLKNKLITYDKERIIELRYPYAEKR